MKTNQEYKNAALASLKGNWGQPVLATLLMAVLMIALIAMCVIAEFAWNPDPVGDEMSIWTIMLLYGVIYLLYYPLGMVGYYNAVKSLYRNGDGRVVSNMFSNTFNGYPKVVGFSLLYYIFVFLWSLLLFIPGIIKSLAYIMSPFILKDNPELSANQAINLSQKMMKGHKFDCFCLILSFIGWIILCVFTFGIGALWLNPYMTATLAAFYEDVKAEYEAKQQIAA